MSPVGLRCILLGRPGQLQHSTAHTDFQVAHCLLWTGCSYCEPGLPGGRNSRIVSELADNHKCGHERKWYWQVDEVRQAADGTPCPHLKTIVLVIPLVPWSQWRRCIGSGIGVLADRIPGKAGGSQAVSVPMGRSRSPTLIVCKPVGLALTGPSVE